MTAMVRVATSVIGALVAGVLGGVAFSSPPTADPFPELKEKKKPRREMTALETGASRAAETVRGGKGVPASIEAVEFALWLYAEEGRGSDRERAAAVARGVAEPAEALYRVAQAGGPTAGEAEAAYRTRQDDLASVETLETGPYAELLLAMYARAACLREPAQVGEALLATGTFWQLRTRQEGNQLRVLTRDGKPETLAGHTAALRVGLEAAALSGSPPVREECRMLAHEMVARFWNEGAGRFRDGGAGGVGGSGAGSQGDALRENARAALAVWETGFVTGDRLLLGRGERALTGTLEESLKDPGAVAAAGLAAGRLSRHPVQMALIGDAAEPTLVELRHAAYFLFEPSKVMLNLDPAADAPRFAELLYPPELAPALFICVETVCSPPITKAEGLEGQVREIRKLAGEAR